MVANGVPALAPMGTAETRKPAWPKGSTATPGARPKRPKRPDSGSQAEGRGFDPRRPLRLPTTITSRHAREPVSGLALRQALQPEHAGGVVNAGMQDLTPVRGTVSGSWLVELAGSVHVTARRDHQPGVGGETAARV